MPTPLDLPIKPNLAGRVAVVTGASGVLCSAMARALAACGMRVGLIGRNAGKLAAVAALIREDGGEALELPCDVLDRESLIAAREALEARFGPCDLLINGAGGNDPRATSPLERLDAAAVAADPNAGFLGLDVDAVRGLFELNFLGTLQPTQIFAQGMAARGRGHIINISSMAAQRPLTKVMAYGAAKAAVNNLTQWLAVHFAPVNVRVNAIAPGFFLTEQNRGLLTTPEGEPTPRAQAILAHTPQGRFGVPADLLGALLWLASDEASGFVTGQIIAVDGGFGAWSGV